MVGAGIMVPTDVLSIDLQRHLLNQGFSLMDCVLEGGVINDKNRKS